MDQLESRRDAPILQADDPWRCCIRVDRELGAQLLLQRCPPGLEQRGGEGDRDKVGAALRVDGGEPCHRGRGEAGTGLVLGEVHDAGQYAAGADVGQLVLTHLVPWNDREQSLREAASAYSGSLSLATSGQVIDLG